MGSYQYSPSGVKTKRLRSRSMLETRGKSVCDSAVSSSLSICVLFLCEVQVLVAFANIFTMLVIYSLVWSMLCFAAIMMTFGSDEREEFQVSKRGIEAAKDAFGESLKKLGLEGFVSPNLTGRKGSSG